LSFSFHIHCKKKPVSLRIMHMVSTAFQCGILLMWVTLLYTTTAAPSFPLQKQCMPPYLCFICATVRYSGYPTNQNRTQPQAKTVYKLELQATYAPCP
jgi:hypothetical protein